MRRILPTILALLTGYDRYFPGIVWSEKSWTHNVFRVYEMIFGRRAGIKAEMSAWKDADGKQCYAAHSWEAGFAVAETYVREFLTSLKPRPFKIFVPMLQTTEGFAIPASPFLFAIALDATGRTPSDNSSTNTIVWNHTVTGSNPLIMLNAYISSAPSPLAFTYNLIPATETISSPGQNSSWWTNVWLLGNPATGTNQVSMTALTAGDDKGGCSISYTGAQSSSVPDSVNKGNSASATSLTVATTVVAANCWLVGFFISGNNSLSMSTGTTRVNAASAAIAGDSSGTVGTGSQQLVFGSFGSSACAGIVASIAPFVTPSGPANWKTWNTVTVATNLKTLDTNALANIKTYDTIS